ncbi:MAG: MarR family winged helix-turn-helix transcriptional regulator [Synergistaceae bacterium]|nr:MarR family winged helix-turn-helix transcriptional regulator [Synergistaceae bacterium]
MKKTKETTFCYCTALRKATRTVSRMYNKALEPSGLLSTQYALLNHLNRLGPVSMNELAESLRLERTTLVRNLNPLLEQEFVGTESIQGTKAHRVFLTPLGKNALEGARPCWLKAQRTLRGYLSEEEESILLQALQKLENCR